MKWAVCGAHTEEAHANHQHSYHGAEPSEDTRDNNEINTFIFQCLTHPSIIKRCG